MRALSDDETSATTLSTSNSDGITFSVPTTVPVPTTTGEALRWGSDAEVDDLTTTGAVRIDLPLNGMSLYQSTGTTNSRNFRIDQSGGTLYIRPAADDGTIKAQGLTMSQGGVVTIGARLDVPDATADGQALAYGQDSWVLGGGVIQQDNNANIIFIDPAGAADQRRLQMTTAYGGFYVRRMSDAGAPGPNSIVVGLADGAVTMTGAPSVSVPAVADGATEAAAQVTARDSGTGQLAIAGIEMGDTGWRDVSTLVEAGWEESRVFIRRTGMVATMQATVKTADTGTITAYCYSLPNGFRTARFAFTEDAGSSRAATMGPARDEGGSGTAYLFAISGNSATSAAATRARITDLAGVNQSGNGRTWSFEATWTVRDADAWPTSLPGTAV